MTDGARPGQGGDGAKWRWQRAQRASGLAGSRAGWPRMGPDWRGMWWRRGVGASARVLILPRGADLKTSAGKSGARARSQWWGMPEPIEAHETCGQTAMRRRPRTDAWAETRPKFAL